MQPASPEKKYLLCLHGFNQNSISFCKRIKVLTKFLESTYSIDFLFPNAPYLLSDAPLSEEEKLYGWLYFDESDKALNSEKIKEKFTQETIEYLGFPGSQAVIESFLANYENIIGILAFSQGALLATLILIQAYEKKLKGNLLKNLKFVVLISGLGKPMPSNGDVENVREYAEGRRKIEVPVLIVRGVKDEYITKEQTESLFKYYSNYEVWEHEGKHFVPSKKEDLQIYKKFLDQYLKK